jgi:hypothetical protein
MLREKRRTRLGRARSFVPVLGALLLLQNAAIVSADGTAARVGSLHPVLRWACGVLDGRLEDGLAIDVLLPRDEREERFKLGVCTRFRGGQLDQHETNQVATETTVETTTTLTIEKTEKPDYSTSPYAFSLFQEGDGSQEDPDGIPTRYLKMQGLRRDNAKKALEATLIWREANDIDTILARPNTKFDVCKRVFPHYFCGRDDTNHVILLQRPGLIDLGVAEANGLTGDDLLYHYVYEMEYLWQILEPTPNGTMTSIIDLVGLNFSVLTKRELVNVVQKFCSTMDAHFPQRSHKTLLINSPKWFGAIYKLISPLLRESTKQKISILSKGKAQDEALKNLLSECPIDLNEKLEDVPPATMEDDLRDFVSRPKVARVPDLSFLLLFAKLYLFPFLFSRSVYRTAGGVRYRNAASHFLKEAPLKSVHI